MILDSSASLCFCTSSDPRLRALSDLPTGVWPLPSGPWHIEHRALNSAAPSSARSGMASSARMARMIVVLMGTLSPSFQAAGGGKSEARPFLEPAVQDARVGQAAVLQDLHGLDGRLVVRAGAVG